MNSTLRNLRVLALVFALALVSAFGAGLAHAQSRHPFTTTECDTNFGAGCESAVSWSGLSIHGIATTVSVNNPGGGNQESFQQFISVDTSAREAEVVGIIHYPGICGGILSYYYIIGGSGYKCKTLPSGDINKNVTLELSYYVSNGGGGFAWIINDYTNTTICNPCSYGDSKLTSPFVDANMVMGEANSAFTGHEVWGTDWQANKYFTGTSWNYDNQTTPGNGTIDLDNDAGIDQGPPPQGYWFSDPNGVTNQGGSLYTCVYDSSGNTCTIGS